MIKVLGLSEGMAAAAQDAYDDLKVNDEIENTATYSTLKKLIKRNNLQQKQILNLTLVARGLTQDIDLLMRLIHGRDLMIHQFIQDTRKELDSISQRAKRK